MIAELKASTLIIQLCTAWATLYLSLFWRGSLTTACGRPETVGGAESGRHGVRSHCRARKPPRSRYEATAS